MNELSTQELLGRIAMGAAIELGLAKETDPRAPAAREHYRKQRLALEEELERRGGVKTAKAEERPAPGPNDVVIQLKPADLSAAALR
jgi:hypothetical protein